MHPSLIRLLPIAFLLLLGGCMSPGIPQASGSGEQPVARALLQKSADAHGLAAFRQIDDLSVGYAGEWYGLVSKVQPTLIDADFRQGSQERIIFKDGPVIAQRHLGPKGNKQVIRRTGDVQVFYNDVATTDREVLAAAALVADGYRMFLTGPFYFLDGNLSLEVGEDETVEGRPCTTLVAVRRPGHGQSAEDRYQLFIDTENHLLRRVRFTMEGLESTQGAIAEVDFFDHKEIAGVTWPTRFYERLRKPIPSLPVHDWRLIGLDVNRGLSEADIAGPSFSAKAAEAARPIK
uniref:Lipoprotein n=1 Tax=Dechloromonas aromatica (strain RCB) TaxID=159087 RepID=Q47GZ2_DECAR